MGDPTGLSYYVARRRVGNERNGDLVELGRFAAKILTKQVLRDLLAAASVPGATAGHLIDARRFVAGKFFGALDPAQQLKVVELYAGTATSDALRAEFLSLLDQPTFAVLGLNARWQLLRYAAGPKAGPYSHETRGAELKNAWALRVRELNEFIAQVPASEADRGVLSYLVEAARPLHILRTVADLDLIILVFGSPSDPESLSYSRFYAYDRQGHAEAAVVSPDPRVATRWQGRTPLSDQVFEVRSAALTRLEELEVIRWIEHNHAIGPDERYRPSRVPFSVFAHARRFAETIEPVLNMIASIRGPIRFERSFLRRGEAADVQRRRLRRALARATA